MRQPVLLAFLLIGLVFGISASKADVFASRIQVTNPDGSPFDGSFTDGTGAKISYVLNDTATTVEVNVLDAGTGTPVATINASDQGHGRRA